MKPFFKKSGLSCALASVLILSACTTTGSNQVSQVEADRAAELDRRAAALDAREAELKAISQSGTGAAQSVRASVGRR